MGLRFKIYLGFIVICLLWGSSWAAVKIGLESIPPLLSLAIRFSVASIILALIVITRRISMPRDRHFWSLVIILCVASFTVPFIIIYYAQIEISSSLASVLFATFPFWVAIMSNIVLPEEKISRKNIIGILIGFIGVITIFYNGLSFADSNSMWGMIAVVIASIIQSVGLVLLRKSKRSLDPVSLNFWPMLISVVPMFISSLCSENYSKINFDYKEIISILYLSVFCTVITFLIYFWLVKHVEAVILSLSSFISPVIAVLIGYLLMNEILDISVFIGSFLVVSGIAVVTMEGWKRLLPRRIKY